VLLTGMGDDGARGLLELRQAGAATLVQDENSSVVWGMPGAAWKLGAASEMLPLDHIASRLLDLARQPLAGAMRA
jgi:two-component system chemotaxis response regulator CheB